MNEPIDDPLWNSFAQYATETGISLHSEDDWRPWWECFLAGGKAQDWRIKIGFRDVQEGS